MLPPAVNYMQCDSVETRQWCILAPLRHVVNPTHRLSGFVTVYTKIHNAQSLLYVFRVYFQKHCFTPTIDYLGTHYDISIQKLMA